MRRKAPTGRFAPVSDVPVRLIVDYESADDFLADYADNLSRLEGLVQTERVVPVGTQLLLGLEFAGLREPIILDAIVLPPASDDEGWTRVQLLRSAELRLHSLVESGIVTKSVSLPARTTRTPASPRRFTVSG